jgi:hypothetical protein
MDEYICSTCNHQGGLAAIACGHWSYCQNFARARDAGTLPNPMPPIHGGPTPDDCLPGAVGALDEYRGQGCEPVRGEKS